MEGMVILTSDELRQIIRDEISNIVPKSRPAEMKRYNVEEASAYLNIPVPSFRTHQRKIGGTKIGKRWMFTQVELDRFIERYTRKSQSDIREAI